MSINKYRGVTLFRSMHKNSGFFNLKFSLIRILNINVLTFSLIALCIFVLEIKIPKIRYPNIADKQTQTNIEKLWKKND